MRRPIIGITTYGRDEDNRFRLPCLYVDAVRRAGGVAVLIPPGEEPGEEIFSIVDGVILAGGGDIDPALYGGTQARNDLQRRRGTRQSELALARHLAGSSVPTLGICRGHQVINVALGGTLYEHLPEVVGDRVVHRLPPREPTEHPIVVAEGSRLASLLGETSFVAASWHHQAIRKLASGLSAVAQAPDGTIEGCEMHSHPWFFSVQWHPELTAHASPTQQRLFDSLVEACRQRIARATAGRNPTDGQYEAASILRQDRHDGRLQRAAGDVDLSRSVDVDVDFEADAEFGEVDARLDRKAGAAEDAAGFVRLEIVHVRAVAVHLLPDAVPRAVDESVAVAGRGNHVAGRPVDFPSPEWSGRRRRPSGPFRSPRRGPWRRSGKSPCTSAAPFCRRSPRGSDRCRRPAAV